MPATDAAETQDLGRSIERLFTSARAQRPQAVRAIFVERLDFLDRSVDLPLHREGLPPAAQRVAERDGVAVVFVQLPTAGRITGRLLSEAFKDVTRTLSDVFLVVANDDAAEWQLVYPTSRGGREVLRRMALQRGHPYRTVVEQLAEVYWKIARGGDLRAALDGAYDVEAVTKTFFREYDRIFKLVLGQVTGLADDDERKLFCQTLFNRLMFLYFLQRKGWLTFDGDPNYLHALWRDYQTTPETERAGNFYTGRLRPLFFTALSNARSANPEMHYADGLIGRVPFLNGGLFAQDALDQRAGAGVPDDAIGTILHRLFERFNFTIMESTPYDVEVAVDPEMLGKVFEELVTGRHETGSYYTPRPVVSFMCREALKGYLAARVEGLPEAAVAPFVDEHSVAAIPVSRAGAVLDALEAVTVVDPACGSGAYLLGMLHELVDLQRLLYNSAMIAGSRELYELKLRVIERNVYGVDVDRFAVNIAMLRLWLSLIVDFEGRFEDIPALPNLDYKIARGDSLTAPNPQQTAPDLISHRARELAAEISRYKGAFLRATGDEKRHIQQDVERGEAELRGLLAHSAIPAEAIDWRVQFAEVFERGGFDIVLANPPYVRADAQFKHLKGDEELRQKEIGKWRSYRSALLHSKVYQTLFEKWDLYIPFLERAYQFLSSHGQMIFIVADSYNSAKYASKSHAFFLDNAKIERVDFCSDIPLFNAGVFNTILHFSESQPSESFAPVRVRRWGDEAEDFEANHDPLATAPQAVLSEAVFRIDNPKANQLEEGTVPLRTFCYISYGLRANADDRNWLGEFTTEDCLSATKDSTHPKPFVQGKDLLKWWPRRAWYLEWGTARAPQKFSRPTFPQLHEASEKLIAVRTPGATPKVIYDNHQLFFDASSVGFVPWHYLTGVRNKSIRKTAKYKDELGRNEIAPEIMREDLEACSRQVSIKYLLAIMNSTLAKNWLAAGRRKSKLHIYPDDWKSLPIKLVPIEQQMEIVQLVDAILSKLGQHGDPLAAGEISKVSELEREIDARVARLYGLSEADLAAMQGARMDASNEDDAATA